MAAAAGADAIGLNFFSSSIRYVPPPRAREIASELPSGVASVGVFVDMPPEQIATVADEVGLDAIQLHGDHGPAAAHRIRAATGRQTIGVIRLPTGTLHPDEIDRRFLPWLDAGIPVLVDAHSGGEFGGTGRHVDWEAIGRWMEQREPFFWVLAGGLNPENVARAIAAAGAPAVDVASGVEQPRGEKSAVMVAQFVENARRAFAPPGELRRS